MASNRHRQRLLLLSRASIAIVAYQSVPNRKANRKPAVYLTSVVMLTVSSRPVCPAPGQVGLCWDWNPTQHAQSPTRYSADGRYRSHLGFRARLGHHRNRQSARLDRLSRRPLGLPRPLEVGLWPAIVFPIGGVFDGAFFGRHAVLPAFPPIS